MASRNEITRAIARELSKLENPRADPDEEMELGGSVLEEFVSRSEGAGAARIRFGPRYSHFWKEAQKLAVAVEIARERG